MVKTYMLWDTNVENPVGSVRVDEEYYDVKKDLILGIPGPDGELGCVVVDFKTFIERYIEELGRNSKDE